MRITPVVVKEATNDGFNFGPGEKDAFSRLWSWSFACLTSRLTEVPLGDYNPKPDMGSLSGSLLIFIVEQGSECPLGYLARMEICKRDGRLIDWKFDSFDSEGRVNTSLVLKEPLQYTSFEMELGSLESQ